MHKNDYLKIASPVCPNVGDKFIFKKIFEWARPDFTLLHINKSFKNI